MFDSTMWHKRVRDALEKDTKVQDVQQLRTSDEGDLCEHDVVEAYGHRDEDMDPGNSD